MAKAGKKELQTQLNTLIVSYGENKEQLDSIDKVCKKENGEIKTLMQKLKCTECASGDYVAKYIVENHDNMREDKLLELFSKDYQYYLDLGIIRQKDYIDSDALEDAIYHGKIDKKELLEMDKCREHKEVVKLKISKAKKGEK